MRSLILAWTLVAARAANTCPGQAACSGIIPCAADYFCNFDYGSSGTCEQCSSFSDSAACYTDGLPSAGEADCEACCFRNYWAVGSGWCSSDLDEYVGDTSDASACWTTCEGRYGSDLVAIDWTPDGECYCQDDCQCMEDTDDSDIHSDIHLITRSDVASLPNACSATCRGQRACDWDGSPCAADEFCNFDGGFYGSCEKCSDEDHCDRGLPSEGEADCKACCGLKEEANRNNVGLLILIIVCSVMGACCLLAISTAIIYKFGGCFCFAKHKKQRVAEPSAPSAPVPLAAAYVAEAPPSPGPPPLAPIKATETLAAERP